MSPQLAIAIGVLLLAANAFFVGAEFAILSARRSAMEPRAQAGDKRAITVLWAMERVSLMLASAQLGVTVCSTGLGIIAEPTVAKVIEPVLEWLRVPHQFVHPIAFVLALSLVVYLHVVLGEMVPKNMAVSNPDSAVLLFGPPLVMISKVLRPIVGGLNWLANHIIRLFGITPKDEVASAFTAQEVHSIVERSQAEGMLEDDEGLLAGALEFSEYSAADVMVPLGELVTLPLGVTTLDVEAAVAKTGFSRFPVMGDDGALVGYLHLKDVLGVPDAQAGLPVDPWRIRALVDVEPSTEIEEVLGAMQRSGAHLARVPGAAGVLGVVFLEDILEELVGEVRDAMQRDSRRP